MYPSMLSRAPDIETEPYYCLPVSGSLAWSQPTSPTPRGLTSLLSPTHINHRLVYQKKNDDGKANVMEIPNVDSDDDLASSFSFLDSSWKSNILNVGRVIDVRLDNGRATTSQRSETAETRIDGGT